MNIETNPLKSNSDIWYIVS
jgi:hypothetical protein